MIKQFLGEELGAVTIEWVILTAAIVALALGATGTLGTAMDGQKATIASKVTAAGN